MFPWLTGAINEIKRRTEASKNKKTKEKEDKKTTDAEPKLEDNESESSST